jgi:hypothetical protein
MVRPLFFGKQAISQAERKKEKRKREKERKGKKKEKYLLSILSHNIRMHKR